MRIKVSLIAAALVLCGASAALALDEIGLYSVERPVLGPNGSVIVGRDEVTMSGKTERKQYPVADVRWIKFGGEPAELSEAKVQARSEGKYAEALEELEKIKKGDIGRPEAVADLEFYIALCKAKLALAGKSPAKGAKTALAAFIKAHDSHYTYYEANELLGDLSRADKDYAGALKSYSELAKNKEYKLKAAVLAGWIRLEEQKPQEALKAFEVALTDRSPEASAEFQRGMATLGKAACISEGGKPADAIKMIEDVIEKTPAESLNARMYNVLGAAQAKNKQPKLAVLAFLHVDLHYKNDPIEHAEALGNLKDLWRQVGRPERADDAARRLRSDYPASKWSQ